MPLVRYSELINRMRAEAEKTRSEEERLIMQIRYFESSWNDIKNSPGWFGKLCLLALIGFIPIFGQIVIMGYLYGWAREMAWGVHEPLPQRIFGNEDGKLYRRGFFILVISIVFSLIPLIIISVGSGLLAYGMSMFDYRYGGAGGLAAAGGGTIVLLIGSLFSIFVSVLAWVAYMRASVYDRISAGFQLGKIWKMIRHNTGGILRVFGMNLLVSLVMGLILSVVMTIIMMIFIFAGAAGMGSYYYGGSDSAIALVLAAGGVGIILVIAVSYIALVASMFLEMLTARALGYWTMQFDVPHWRGQDDPMPFEMQPVTQPASQQAYYAQQQQQAGAQPAQQWQAPAQQAAQQWQAPVQQASAQQAASQWQAPVQQAAPVSAPAAVAGVAAGVVAAAATPAEANAAAPVASPAPEVAAPAAAAPVAAPAPEAAAPVASPAPEAVAPVANPVVPEMAVAAAIAEALTNEEPVFNAQPEAAQSQASFTKGSESLHDDPDYHPIVVGLDFFAEPEEEWVDDKAGSAVAEEVESEPEDASAWWGVSAEETVADQAEEAVAAVEAAAKEAADAIADAGEGAAAEAAEAAEPLIAPPGMSSAEFEAGNKPDEPAGGEE